MARPDRTGLIENITARTDLARAVRARPSGENNTTTRSLYLFYARSVQGACASAKVRGGAYSKNTPRCSAKIRITYSK